MLSKTLVLLCLAVAQLLVQKQGCVEAQLDADKAAELSRWIRQHFRDTGMNWVSPKMLKELELKRNTKPIMYLFTSRSCADCRLLMSGFALKDRTMLSSISSQYLSVLVLDDYSLYFGPEYEPRNADYQPRILFAGPDGTLRLDLKNPSSDKDSPYYYASVDEVIEGMQTTLTGFQREQGTLKYPGNLEMDM